MRLWKKKTAFEQWKNREKYPVEPMFAIGERTFYAFTDVNNMPAGRALAAIPLYVELKNNADHEYLGYFVKAFEAVLNDPAKINIEKLVNLKNQIKERLSWVYTPDLVLKYASVVYFDQHEDPEYYDEAYNAKKIEFWKQNPGAHSFFLAEPIQALVPALKTVSGSIPMYSSVILKAQAIQLRYLSDLISSTKNSDAGATNLSSQIISRSEQLLSEASRPASTSFSSIKKVSTTKS